MALFYFQMVASLSSTAALWLLGNKGPWGARVTVVSILIWWALIFWSGWMGSPLWGIAPVEIIKTVVAARNLIKAEREQRQFKYLNNSGDGYEPEVGIRD